METNLDKIEKMIDKLTTNIDLVIDRLHFLQIAIDDLDQRVRDLEEQWEAGEMPVKADFEDWDN